MLGAVNYNAKSTSDTADPITSKKIQLRIKHVFILVQLKQTYSVSLKRCSTLCQQVIRDLLASNSTVGICTLYTENINIPRFSKVFHYTRSHLILLH